MKKITFINAILLMASLLSASQAKAAIFNYQFINVNGAVPGTVNGTVTLPDGDGSFASSLVTIDSYPAALNLGATPISILPIDSLTNLFTVTGGEIVNSDYSGLINGSTALSLKSLGFCSDNISFLDSFNAQDCGDSGVLDTASSTLTFFPATADVPGPLPLFGAAAAFAHSRRLRARLRAGSSPQV